MLLNLHVKNLALIDEADVYFRDGLNILTGETGAGKSIIIGSMNLALGAKVPKDLVRHESQDAFVELTFEIDNDAQKAALQELGVDVLEGQVILTRRLVGGRSISKINSQTANSALLKDVAGVLLDMHGQHEHQSLLYKKKHLEILDAYGKAVIGPKKEQVAVLYGQYREAKERLEKFTVDEDARQREISFLEYEINEIEASAVYEGEDEQVEARYKKLANGKRITESVQEAYALSGYEGGAGEQFGRVCHALSLVAEYDQALAALQDQAAELDGLLNDFNRELSSYQQNMQFGEEEFYETEKRLDELNRLKSKYGRTIRDVLDYLESRKQRLADLTDYEEKKRQLEEALAQTEADYKKEAAALTMCRKQTAEKLTEMIRRELADLNFLHVSFEMIFEKLDHYTANGVDEAEFFISTNPGEPARPLGAVASGGELSRIMLAVKTVLAEKDSTGTLVFDEIDTGISGRTAQMVSEKMAKIARTHQVICITHLPQIAAMADAHFAIEKSVRDNETETSIRILNEEEIIQELSRMLGGAQITDAVRKNAVEMKKLAETTKLLQVEKT